MSGSLCIPLRMADVPRNVVITSDPDSVVRFTVRDKGYMIAAYGAEDAFRPIYADYRLYTDGTAGAIFLSQIFKNKFIFSWLKARR